MEKGSNTVKRTGFYGEVSVVTKSKVLKNFGNCGMWHLCISGCVSGACIYRLNVPICTII